MGDSRRNIEFAKFICKQFPSVKSILVIADGGCELSYLLQEKGYKIRVIENRKRHSKGVAYNRGFFSYTDIIVEDLIIGMHPDEATGEILLSAKQQNKSYAEGSNPFFRSF